MPKTEVSEKLIFLVAVLASSGLTHINIATVANVIVGDKAERKMIPIAQHHLLNSILIGYPL